MIYIIVTTCIINENDLIRKEKYIKGITQIINATKNIKCKIIIVENNGKRPTYLDTLGCEVYYTENNKLPVKNKGYKELKDIHDCIHHYTILDNDFIVKLTGRYLIHESSEFITILDSIQYEKSNIECIIKYGSFFNPVEYKMNDCITGLIGMNCKYIKQIEYPNENECVEWKWGSITYKIDDSKIYKVNTLGISICPGSMSYFNV